LLTGNGAVTVAPTKLLSLQYVSGGAGSGGSGEGGGGKGWPAAGLALEAAATVPGC
jgi:hypothetical protein